MSPIAADIKDVHEREARHLLNMVFEGLATGPRGQSRSPLLGITDGTTPGFRIGFSRGVVNNMVCHPWSWPISKGPWFNRSRTGGPEPKSKPGQRCSGTSAL